VSITGRHLIPGAMIGRYKVIDVIGRGGMGGVWEVEDDAGRRLALKAPVDEIGESGDSAKRFAREVNAMRVLDHPNLIAAIDVFVESGTLFLVMERVAGALLTTAIKAGPVEPSRALAIARQILAGLGHAHGHGVAHRDLKPDNIMLIAGAAPPAEHVKILDFGLVKLMGDAAALFGGSKLTRTGMVAGTPMYMAPEQALGREVDGRADIYALGVILFEMLAGRTPFESDDPVALMRMQVKQKPPRLDDVARGQPWCTPEIVGLVEGALIKDPAHRFATANAMTNALDHAVASL
jgi:serine/threonine-protein kinase